MGTINKFKNIASGNRDTILAAAICLVTVLPVVIILGASMKPKNAVAAERVLDPDRVYTVSYASAPAPAPLKEGEVVRFPTKYTGATEKLSATEADLYKGYLVLVNSQRPLPEDFEPGSLIVFNEAAELSVASDFSVTKTQMVINPTAGENLLAMVNAASEEAGIRGFLMQSGYRDFAYQAGLHQRKVQEYRNFGYGEAEAVNAAAFWVARPRQSEHHTGLAADVTSRFHPELQLSFAYTENGKWMAEHSWRFGFTIRYPGDKSEITKVGYEPWHLRFVGKPHSELMRIKGWCLEEYLGFLSTEGGVTFKDAGGTIWQIDYASFEEGGVVVPSNSLYAISGDGDKGFIITTKIE